MVVVCMMLVLVVAVRMCKELKGVDRWFRAFTS
jgi:hypothetical protein